MNEMSIFENSEFGKIRCMTIENEPWFVGKDVCEVFGDTNYRRSLLTIDDSDKGVSQIDTPGGKQNMTIINESGFYSLLFQMQPQKAKGVSQNDDLVEERIQRLKRFKRWVTSEVLPSVRKHGAYIKDQEELSPEEIMARGLRAAESIIAEKQKKIEAQEKVIEENKPKVDYYNAVLDSSGLLNITQIAKEFGMTAAHMNELLHDVGIQYRAGKCWVPKQKYVDKGYMKSCTRLISGRTTIQYRWTQKGREFIHRVMAKYGYSPIYSEESMLA